MQELQTEDYNEVIKCPNCSQIQIGTVVPTLPFNTFVHECESCKYIIMESEWNKQEVKALTIKQPYASLCLEGKIETRTWQTHYRGVVLIHAAASKPSNKHIKEASGIEQSVRVAEAVKSCTVNPDINRGKIIGIAELYDCHPMRPDHADQCFVAYNPGLWCHKFRNIQFLSPIKAKGLLNYWKPSQEIINQLLIIPF